MIIKERDLVGIKLILNQSKISSSIVNFKICIIESGKEIKHIKESNSFIYKNIMLPYPYPDIMARFRFV